MKTQTKQTKVIPFPSKKAPVYPNAADKSYYIQKAIDYALTTVTSAGIVTALTFILFLL